MTKMKLLAHSTLILLIYLASNQPSLASVLNKSKPMPALYFRARFTETRILPGFSQHLLSSGQVIFSRSGGISWEVTAPYHYVFKMNATRAEEQMPDGSVRRLSAKQAPWLGIVRHIFMNTLTGNISNLQHYFFVHILAMKTGRCMVLIPRLDPLEKVIKAIYINASASGVPHVLRIDEPSGGSITIRFFDIVFIPEER